MIAGNARHEQVRARALEDMRRFEVMMSAEFPSELNGLFKGLESKGNPWSMSPRGRMEWAKDLPFLVPVVGEDVEDLSQVE